MERSESISKLDADSFGDTSSIDGGTLNELPGQSFNRFPKNIQDSDSVRTVCPDLSNAVYRFPDGIPNGSSLYVASSRLGQQLDQHDRWFDGLRTLVSRLNPEQTFLMTHAGTTADRFVRRVAELFGIPYLEMIPWQSISEKEKQIVIQRSAKPGVRVATSQSSPKKFVGYYQLEHPLNPDQLMIGWAKRVVLLSVRAGGNVLAAVRSRLAANRASDDQSLPSEIRLLISPELTKPTLQQDLIQQGAIGWYLFDHSQDDLKMLVDFSIDHGMEGVDSIQLSDQLEPSDRFQHSGTANNRSTILPLDEFPEEDFLIHWTRRCSGPWPDQADWQYIDELLFRSEKKYRGELQVLRRIVATGRLLSSGRWNRAGREVVSFSDRRLSEISKLKKFRPHLGRWDFLPYGIAIQRNWIAQHGGRPVIYGEQPKWEQLDQSQRPYFQPSLSRDGKMDWRQEREWRWLGDFDLKQPPIEAVAVFVSDLLEAESMVQLSRWPVVYLNR